MKAYQVLLKSLLTLLIVVSLAFTLVSQDKKSTHDYADYDRLIDELYMVISGPAGERDWDLFKSMFHENALMGAVRMGQDGKAAYRSFTPEEYVTNSGAYFKENPFYEEEIHRKVDQFGEVLHVFSSYQYRFAPGGEPQQRGINSIQLVFDNGRWWIISIQWTNEREGLAIPKSYLN